MPEAVAQSWIRWWAPALALVLASGLAFWSSETSSSARSANLSVGACPLPETYVMFHKTDAGTGYVVERRRSTMRRGDAKQPGRRWRIDRVQGPFTRGGRDTWILRSKVHGGLLLLPVEDVPDWSLPMVHGVLRAQAPELNLAEVAWVSLFINRVYSGLFLQLALPADVRRKDGGSGELRVMLETDGQHTARIDTRFEDDSGAFISRVAAGLFPTLAEADPRVAWLQARSALRTQTLLQDFAAPYAVHALPLPVQLAPLFEALHRRPPGHLVDARAARWLEKLAKRVPSQPFEAGELAPMRAAFLAYAGAFRHGLRLDAQVRGTALATDVDLRARSKSALALGWDLAEPKSVQERP